MCTRPGDRPILALNLAALPNDLPEHVTGTITTAAKLEQAAAAYDLIVVGA
ncbi:MAG: hypothetical protein KJZ87_01745 [Thermoguttaceae bacterium]|nr:hypothetical protein [Thermoguttaceae bacterium]